MLVNLTGISGHDLLSLSNMLGGMASVSCSNNIAVCVDFCVHFLSCGVGSVLTQNDYQQAYSTAKLDSLSCLYYEQDRLSIHFLIHSFLRYLDILRNAVRVFILAILVLHSKLTLLQQKGNHILQNSLSLLFLDHFDAYGESDSGNLELQWRFGDMAWRLAFFVHYHSFLEEIKYRQAVFFKLEIPQRRLTLNPHNLCAAADWHPENWQK